MTLPDKIKRKQFTREEQMILAGRLRESVILDAADEAFYKASRRATRNLTPLFGLSSPSTTNSSMDSRRLSEDTSSSVAAVIYDSFRWMDEEEDLDLKLQLDDYHANLDGFVIPTPASIRRPSFRRQMSITKLPFSRTSLSSMQARSPRPSQSPKPESASSPTSPHIRQKSLALSLIAPKHIPNASISSIDPNATHYQDPEARLKLRVYLASPQKFDEAIEFGFPSLDGVTEGTDKENKPPLKGSSVGNTAPRLSYTPGNSFLNDDNASLFEDDVSMVEPESPQTPFDPAFRPQQRVSPILESKGSRTSGDFLHLGITKPPVVKQLEPYSQAMAGSREMTLRMTLTRPDLRADESALYGWQSSKSPLREDPSSSDEPEEKFEMRGPLGGVDGWGPMEKEDGVVKRFWNKVKS